MGYKLGLLYAVLLFFAVFTLKQHNAYAFSWDRETVNVTSADYTRQEWSHSYMKGCTYEQIEVYQTVLTEKPCVIRGEQYSLAKINTYGCAQQCYAFASGNEDIFYRVDLRKDQIPTFFRGSDKITFSSTMFQSTYFYGPVYYNDVSDLLTFDTSSSYFSIYMKNKTPDYSLIESNGQPSSARYLGASANGEYIMYGGYSGVFILDTKKLSLTKISSENIGNGEVNGAVSNDGRMIVIGGKGYFHTKVYDITGCGETVNYTNAETLKINDCSYDDLTSQVNDVYGDVWYKDFEILEGNKTVRVIYDNVDGYSVNAKQLTIGKQPAINVMDYLALGDSYSSGEGDIGKQVDGRSFYLIGTGHDGGCHISSRSYPFLLAQYQTIPERNMKSVACSGAQVAKDYSGQTQNYLGQSGQLKGQSSSEQEASRAAALKNFTPGVVKQIEFVRANKPKVITINGGGNDIGFSNVIKSCIYTVGIGKKTGTCDEAVPGSAKRTVIGDAIHTQYEQIVDLIKAIKSASESTTIHVIGYPTFLADGTSGCVNSGALTQQERQGINDGVRYLNRVISSAAGSAGAKYVDIEASLVGGRLCEGSEYMTGIVEMIRGVSMAQMFHPNHLGHAEMARMIHSSGFSVTANNNPAATGSDSPSRPESFKSGAYIPTFQERLLVDAAVIVGKSSVVKLLAEGVLRAGDKATFTLHSKPVDLGTYTTSPDGSLAATLNIPSNIALGAHMLVADVTSQDGSKKRLYQYVEVHGKDTNDIDGDKIPNDSDACAFIVSWVDESTNEDVCRAHRQNGVIPGRGVGHGYGHMYSSGLHKGHNHDTSFIFTP